MALGFCGTSEELGMGDSARMAVGLAKMVQTQSDALLRQVQRIPPGVTSGEQQGR